MNRRSPFFWPSLWLLIGIAGYTGAAVIPAVIPQVVPTANKQGNSTKFQLAGTISGTTGASTCTDASGNITDSGCLGSGLYSQAASVTVANTVTTTSIISATGAQGSVTLPANFFSASGVALKIRVWGIHSASGNPTIDWKVSIGGTTVLDTTAVTSGNSTNQAFDIDAVITCRTTGTTGTVFGQGKYIEVGNALFPMSNTGTQTINTTISNVIDINVTWGTASASNTLTATNVVLQGVFGAAAPTGGGGTGAVTQISKQTLAVSASSITFSAIPGTYNNLEVTLQGRTDSASTSNNVTVTFNGDSAANYNYGIVGQFAQSGTATATPQVCFMTAGNSTANYAGACKLSVNNYASTTFFKEAISLSYLFNSGNTTEAIVEGGMDWKNTAAITSITFTPAAAANFIAGTTAILYGYN